MRQTNAMVERGTENSNPSEKLGTTVQASLLVAGAACLLLLAVRIRNSFSFSAPYLLSTTGYEWESLYSIWCFVQHQTVYANPHRIPFSASYFNWAYYFFYGSTTKVCLRVMHFDATWIATIGRLISFGFTLAAGGILVLAWRALRAKGAPISRPSLWAWLVIATLGPLVGFWAITTRPDMGALALECAGLYMILRLARGGDWRFVAAATLLFYGAWAFKQSQVTMLAGSVLALLLLKRWRAAVALSLCWWALVTITLGVGGPVYRQSVLLSQRNLPFVVWFGVWNLLSSEIKNPFLWLGMAAAVANCWRQMRSRTPEPAQTVLATVTLFSFGFALAASCKAGANDNYFIPAGWVSMLGLALNWEQTQRGWMRIWLVAGSWALAASIALSATGLTYLYDFRYQDDFHRMLADKMQRLPEPVYATDLYANLPWMHRGAPYFVVGFSYEYECDAGVAFERGGIEGLARDGYFGTLIIDEEHALAQGLLAKYVMADEFKGPFGVDYKVYRRAEANDRPGKPGGEGVAAVAGEAAGATPPAR